MKIKILPQNIEINGDPGKTLLQICLKQNVSIKSTCKGNMSCADCRIKIVSGEHNILPPQKSELNLIGTNYFVDGRRLACQVRAFGDITIDISEQAERTEPASKKVRGFRNLNKESVTESKALQDTLVLKENKS